jgi:hypothetical protein
MLSVTTLPSKQQAVSSCQVPKTTVSYSSARLPMQHDLRSSYYYTGWIQKANERGQRLWGDSCGLAVRPMMAHCKRQTALNVVLIL